MIYKILVESKEGPVVAKVEGERVLRDEFPDFHLFVHRPYQRFRLWNVSEKITGMAIISQYDDKDTAIEAAREDMESRITKRSKAYVKRYLKERALKNVEEKVIM